MAKGYPLREAVVDKKIIIIGGSGGVGKTTVSAAIAIKAAQIGKRTLVMTIDPAKRLASALGLKGIGNEPVEIEKNLFGNSVPMIGKLYAMMLDLKSSADVIVNTFSPNRDIRDKIINHPFYQQASTFLQGSQEYIAAERLHHYYNSGSFDLIILDTPPSRNAIDFLEGPIKVMEFLRSRIINWFLKPYLKIGRFGFDIFKKHLSGFFRIIENITGAEFLFELSEFMLNFETMYEKFRIKAEDVYKLLRSKETIFFLVTSASKGVRDEGFVFKNALDKYKIAFGGVIFNRCQTLPHPFIENEDIPEGVISEKGRIMIKGLLEDFYKRQESDLNIIRNVSKRLKIKEVIILPELIDDVHSIGGLVELNRYLFGRSFF